MINMFIPNQQSRKNLAHKLNLNFDESMQDWEYEIADYKRLNDFLNEYEKTTTTESEKQSLMEIIIDSLNDLLLDEDEATFNQYLPKTISLIKTHKAIHVGSLAYWTRGFAISEILRAIKL
jgi:hypothetical protein